MERETLFVVSRPMPNSAMYVFRTRKPAREFAAAKNLRLLVPAQYQYKVHRAQWGPDNASKKETP